MASEKHPKFENNPAEDFRDKDESSTEHTDINVDDKNTGESLRESENIPITTQPEIHPLQGTAEKFLDVNNEQLTAVQMLILEIQLAQSKGQGRMDTEGLIRKLDTLSQTIAAIRKTVGEGTQFNEDARKIIEQSTAATKIEADQLTQQTIETQKAVKNGLYTKFSNILTEYSHTSDIDILVTMEQLLNVEEGGLVHRPQAIASQFIAAIEDQIPHSETQESIVLSEYPQVNELLHKLGENILETDQMTRGKPQIMTELLRALHHSKLRAYENDETPYSYQFLSEIMAKMHRKDYPNITRDQLLLLIREDAGLTQYSQEIQEMFASGQYLESEVKNELDATLEQIMKRTADINATKPEKRQKVLTAEITRLLKKEAQNPVERRKYIFDFLKGTEVSHLFADNEQKIDTTPVQQIMRQTVRYVGAYSAYVDVTKLPTPRGKIFDGENLAKKMNSASQQEFFSDTDSNGFIRCCIEKLNEPNLTQENNRELAEIVQAYVWKLTQVIPDKEKIPDSKEFKRKIIHGIDEEGPTPEPVYYGSTAELNRWRDECLHILGEAVQVIPSSEDMEKVKGNILRMLTEFTGDYTKKRIIINEYRYKAFLVGLERTGAETSSAFLVAKKLRDYVIQNKSMPLEKKKAPLERLLFSTNFRDPEHVYDFLKDVPPEAMSENLAASFIDAEIRFLPENSPCPNLEPYLKMIKCLSIEQVAQISSNLIRHQQKLQTYEKLARRCDYDLTSNYLSKRNTPLLEFQETDAANSRFNDLTEKDAKGNVLYILPASGLSKSCKSRFANQMQDAKILIEPLIKERKSIFKNVTSGQNWKKFIRFTDEIDWCIAWLDKTPESGGAETKYIMKHDAKKWYFWHLIQFINETKKVLKPHTANSDLSHANYRLEQILNKIKPEYLP